MTRNTIGPFEFDVLASLNQQPNDAYGLSLRDRLEERLGRTVSLGAVYTALERLEAKGMVGSWWTDGTPERGGRRKRLYRIEAPGEAAANVFASRFQHGLGIVGGVA